MSGLAMAVWVKTNERRARTPLLRRRSGVARALDQFVLGLRIADHLVLLPVGGGLGSPPVTLGVGLGLVWISDARMSYPRTNAANRSADQTAVRRRLRARYVVLTKASVPQRD